MWGRAIIGKKCGVALADWTYLDHCTALYSPPLDMRVWTWHKISRPLYPTLTIHCVTGGPALVHLDFHHSPVFSLFPCKGGSEGELYATICSPHHSLVHQEKEICRSMAHGSFRTRQGNKRGTSTIIWDASCIHSSSPPRSKLRSLPFESSPHMDPVTHWMFVIKGNFGIGVMRSTTSMSFE